MTVRLPPIDDGKEDVPLLRHTDRRTRCTTIADVARELLLARRHVDTAVLDKAWPRAEHLHGTIPRLPQILRQHGGITHAHACRCKCIHRRAMHRDDIAIGRNQRIIRIDLCHAPIANDILKAIRIRPRRSTIGAVVDDEVVLAALGVDP